MSLLLLRPPAPRPGGSWVYVPDSPKVRGRGGIRSIYWLWPKTHKGTLADAVSHLIDRWEQGG